MGRELTPLSPTGRISPTAKQLAQELADLALLEQRYQQSAPMGGGRSKGYNPGEVLYMSMRSATQAATPTLPAGSPVIEDLYVHPCDS